MQIKYQFENEHRLELQDTTYGDLLNTIEEINSDKETIAQSEVFLQQIKQLKVVDPKITSLDYSKLAKQKHNTAYAIRIVDLLNQKYIDCSSYIDELLRKNTLCAIANKAYDIFTANKCINFTTQSRNIISTNIDFIQSAVEFFYNNNYQEALSQVEKINTEFVAIENIKQAQSISKPMLGKWTKQLKS